MESSYLALNERELELTKDISLAEIDPLALLTLKTTGECTITLPEFTAESFEFSLGPRLTQEPNPTSEPAELYGVNPEGTKPHGKPLLVLAAKDLPCGELNAAGTAASDAGYGRLRLISDDYLLQTGKQSRAVELLFARGEDLAFLDKAPKGFPGGALVVVMQRGSVRAMLMPGLEKSSLPLAALAGVTPSPAGELDAITLSDFLMHFTAHKLIIAAAPNITLAALMQLIDGVKRKDITAEILIAQAPESGDPSWIAALPKALHGDFSSLAPLELDSLP
jgi:hypothetical protein